MLAPTRELAAQVGDTMRALAAQLAEPVKVAIVFGGVSINPQMMALRGGADVVVATPGRLLDLVAHNALDLSGVSAWCSTKPTACSTPASPTSWPACWRCCRRRRQNLFFSATFPPAVQALADGLLHEPMRVNVARAAGARPDVDERAMAVDAQRRTPLLRHLIRQGAWTRVLVFVATRYACEHVADKLRRGGIAAAAFHGDASQGARTQGAGGLQGRHLAGARRDRPGRPRHRHRAAAAWS